MAIADYEDLIALVKSYEDDESAATSANLDNMVSLAENRIFTGGGRIGDPFYTAPLRVRHMERSLVMPIGAGLDGGTSAGTANAQTVTLSPTLSRGVSITFIAGASNTGAMTVNALAVRKGANRDALVDGDVLQGGTYTVYYDGTYWVLMPSDGAAPLPTRYLGHKSAYLQDRGTLLTYQSNSGVNWHMSTDSGVPNYFTIECNCLRLDPLPNADYKVKFAYYERPLPIETALNDIFRDAPNIWLYGALFELAQYKVDAERSAQFFSNFRTAIDGYASEMLRASVAYGTMRVNLGNVP